MSNRQPLFTFTAPYEPGVRCALELDLKNNLANMSAPVPELEVVTRVCPNDPSIIEYMVYEKQ